MSDSEEDDVHFCLRCKGTFIGLDLYIEHRKVKCKRDDSQPLTSLEQRLTKESSGNISLGGGKLDIPSGSDTSNRGSWTLEGLQSSSPTVKDDSRLEDVLQRDILDRKDELDQFLPSHDNDPCIKAVDFFSILELQSSKTPTYNDIPTSQRGMLTRSKSSAVLQAKKNRDPFTPRAFITPDFHSYDPYQNEHGQYLVGRDLVVDEDYEYDKDECGALKERKTSEQSSPKSKTMVEGINSVANINDVNEFQIQDVHSEVTITSERKHEEGSDSYTDESEEDDEDEYEIRRIPSGGKWKPGIDEWSGTFWRSSPPASHTGGKWKPTPPPIVETMKPQPSTSTIHHPPPPSTSTTQQAMVTETQGAEASEISNSRAPSPSHTRGKWLPGPNSTADAKRSFWCGPCNRRLSSSTLYERHCRSDLHLKRTRQEDQLDEDLMAEHMAKGKEEPRAKRDIKRTQAYIDSDLWCKSKKARLRQSSTNPVTPASKTLKGRGSLHCEVCQCRVFPHQIGKHLVSHFHWRRTRSAPELARLLALQNIEHIVVQSPFQCATCKFYCNTMQDFLQHWAGEGHATRDAQFEGKYSCAFCRFETNSSYLMYQHLLGEKHEESVSIIGGSVPIVIQKKTAIQCEVCEKEFLFNLELRKHCKVTGHSFQKSTASDRYQEKERCPECSMLSFSKASLQRHIIWAHKDAENRFFCTCCDLDFQTAVEARSHRSSEAHKMAALGRTGPGDHQQARVCCHCYGVFSSVSELKRHLKDEHPERAYRCIKCGASFALKQQVARHVRIGCENTAQAHVPEVEAPPTLSPSTVFQCSQCAFTSICEAELLFHVVLHEAPLSQGRYQCPSCPRVFTKSSLRKHLFSHTGERPYSCRLCGSSFARKDVLENHVSNVHSMKSIGSSWHVQPERRRTETCDECGAAFYERTTLLQHQVIHIGKQFKCDEEGCVFAARNGADLRLHRRTHQQERPFKCALCQWTAKTKAQLVRHGRTHLEIRTHHCPHCQFACNSSTHLKRHLRLHTGAKPYHCPHCNYTCNLLENLRKHVLSTSKHAGMSLYSCPETGCTFASNTAKDFRSHLTEHGSSPAAAASYVAGLYRGEDPRHVENPLPAPYRKRRIPSKLSETKEVVEEDVILEPNTLADNPTLASTAASDVPGRPDDLLRTVVLADPPDDVICIQLPPDDALESLFFQRPEDLGDHGGLLVIDEGCMVEESVQEYRTEEQD